MSMDSDISLLEDQLFQGFMKDHILKEIVSGNGADNRPIREMLQRLQLNPHFKYPTIAIFEPALLLSADDRVRASEKARQVLSKHVLGGPIIFMYDDCVVMLFSWDGNELVKSCRSLLRSQFVTAFSIGVGSPANWLADIHTSYKQARAALQDIFYQGTGQLISYEQLTPYVRLHIYPLSREKELFDQLKVAEEIHDIERAVSEFYRSLLGGGPIDVNDIYELTVRLLAGIEKRGTSDTKESSGAIRHEITSIMRIKTLRDLERFVSRYLFDLREHMEQSGKDSHRSIIKKTILFMETECQHATLDSVARKVYMTPTYLSLIFKMNTGKTFIEQLTDIRIEKAKKMLQTTCLKNYEVAENVGYQDPRYFSQIFKKKVGVSPSEYRELSGS
jgi:two-component system, response regulator YesN